MNNKKYIIAGVVIALAIAFWAGIFIYYKNHSLKSEIKVKTGSFIVKNTTKSDIQITTINSDKIEISLIGPADELKRVVFNQIDKNTVEFSLPANSKGIKGTIAIPQSIKIIDLDNI